MKEDYEFSRRILMKVESFRIVFGILLEKVWK